MNRREIIVRLESGDQSAYKTIGLAPDGLITVESWRVTKVKAQADLKRKTIGRSVYAPKEAIESFVETVQAEQQGYELQTILDGRSKELAHMPSWMNYTAPFDASQRQNVATLVAFDESIDRDVVTARVGTAIILFMAKNGGVVWVTENRLNAILDNKADHEAMTVLGATTMTLFGTASVSGSNIGYLVDLRQHIVPKYLSDAMQEFGAKAKLFAIPMKFTKQQAAVW